uniref:Uncharacterized protein n=1 Tax=Arundo donax TaxID=35708 RepID=A0A0A9H2X7_ARUDO
MRTCMHMQRQEKKGKKD